LVILGVLCVESFLFLVRKPRERETRFFGGRATFFAKRRGTIPIYPPLLGEVTDYDTIYGGFLGVLRESFRVDWAKKKLFWGNFKAFFAKINRIGERRKFRHVPVEEQPGTGGCVLTHWIFYFSWCPFVFFVVKSFLRAHPRPTTAAAPPAAPTKGRRIAVP